MPKTPLAKAIADKLAPPETKNEKFRRLATARLGKAIIAVEALGGLASKAYDFTGPEVVALMKPLENAVIKVGTKLNTFISSPVATKAAVAAFDPFAVLDQKPEVAPAPAPETPAPETPTPEAPTA